MHNQVADSLFLHFILFFKEALYRIWCGANRLRDSGVHTLGDNSAFVKEALYRIWCGANRLGDSGVHTLGDNSAFFKGHCIEFGVV